MEITICVTNEVNQKLATLQRELNQCHFRLVNIGFQQVQMFNPHRVSEGVSKFQENGKL